MLIDRRIALIVSVCACSQARYEDHQRFMDRYGDSLARQAERNDAVVAAAGRLGAVCLYGGMRVHVADVVTAPRVAH